MSLRNQIESTDLGATVLTMPRAAAPDSRAYQDLKANIHRTLLDRLNLEAMEQLSPERLREELRAMVESLLEEQNVVLNDIERRSLVRDIQHEMLGLGPLESLLADASISDILVNSAQQVYVERGGQLQSSPVTFSDDAHLLKIIDKIVSRVGRRIDESSPMVDARLPDGSRVNVIIPPLALDGPVMSIRRFSGTPLTMERLVEFGSLMPEMAEILQGLAKAKVNILISGGTGSGKTTMLNILSGYIPAAERIITIEDAAELRLQQPHVVRLETRPPNVEGKGEVSQRALVRNSLRMRPDRIILGEVRGGEALDMLQAMNTGHEGSMATVHANTPRDALSRLENMVGMTGINLPSKALRKQIASAITVVLQIARLADGKRKVTSLQEITGMEGEVITMQEIFTFKQTGIANDGSVTGHFCATGVRPKFCDRLGAYGIRLSERLFDPLRSNS
jgi:pilus assembly protein CpaF